MVLSLHHVHTTAAIISAGRQDCAREELGPLHQAYSQRSYPAGKIGRGFLCTEAQVDLWTLRNSMG